MRQHGQPGKGRAEIGKIRDTKTSGEAALLPRPAGISQGAKVLSTPSFEVAMLRRTQCPGYRGIVRRNDSAVLAVALKMGEIRAQCP
ncbi:MAG: hypothetical protein WCC45_03535, partial [Paeniglutamicibacter sp.]